MLVGKINAQQKIHSFSNTPGGFITFNGNIFFLGIQEDSSPKIWKSDGTSANTSILKDVYLPKDGGGAQDLLPNSTAILNGKLFFIGTDGNSVGEIWKTDGTPSGTVKVTNFLNSKIQKLTAVGTSIYFLLQTDYVLQVWKTNGTSDGTILVKDNLPIWNRPTFQGKCNNTFMFTFQAYGSNDSKVWRSDGTSDGTFPITEEIDGNGSGPGGTSALTQYIENGNKLYFVSRNYLFETDGTLEKTKTIANIRGMYNRLLSYSDVISVNNDLYFMFFSADDLELKIWKFDLIKNNYSVIYTNYGSKYFYPSAFVKTDNSLLFSGSNNTGGTSLLSMDLSDYKVTHLKELSPSVVKPFIFVGYFDAATISRINNDEYFISSAVNEKYEKKGWILNYALQTVENISSLDNVFSSIVYKDNLYYGKDNIFWKYANNLNTLSIDNKPFLSLYPNPSDDFIQVNKSKNDLIESINIFDLNGRLVSNSLDFKNDRIEVSGLIQGVYNVLIKLSDGSLVNKKIIKK